MEYNYNYSKTSGSLWQYYRDEPTLTDAGTLTNFASKRALFKFKQKITGSAGNDGTKAVQIMVPLKYLSIILSEKMNDIMRIVKCLEESGLLIKDVSGTIKNEAKEQRGGFLKMLLSTLGAGLLGNLITGEGTNRAGAGTIRTG